MKIDSLVLLGKLLQTHPSEDIDPHMEAIVQAIAGGIDDAFYLITSEALNVCVPLMERIRPVVEQPLRELYRGYTKELFRRTTAKLHGADIDHEVKERAILATCHVIARAGDVLAAELPPCLALLLQHLNNEVGDSFGVVGLCVLFIFIFFLYCFFLLIFCFILCLFVHCLFCC